MKNRIIAILTGLFIIACTVLYITFQYAQAQKKEVERQSKNVQVLNGNLKSYKTAFGNSAANVQSLNYKLSELQAYEVGLIQTIKELKIKPKNVVSMAQIGTETTATINPVIQYADSTKCIHFEDKWTTLNGCFKGDSLPELYICSRDSLIPIVSKIPKHNFLWWSWGVKAIQLDIISKNPNTKFTYLKYFELN